MQGEILSNDLSLELQEAFEFLIQMALDTFDKFELKEAMEALGFAPSEEDVAHMIHIATMGSDAKKIDLPAFCSLMTRKMVFPPIQILGADSRPFFYSHRASKTQLKRLKKLSSFSMTKERAKSPSLI